MKALSALLMLAFVGAATADDAKPNRIERGAQKVEKGLKNAATRTERGVTRTVDKTKKGVERTADRTENWVKKRLE